MLDRHTARSLPHHKTKQPRQERVPPAAVPTYPFAASCAALLAAALFSVAAAALQLDGQALALPIQHPRAKRLAKLPEPGAQPARVPLVGCVHL